MILFRLKKFIFLSTEAKVIIKYLLISVLLLLALTYSSDIKLRKYDSATFDIHLK